MCHQNHAERLMLIRRRTEEDALFSGKNANSNEGWKKALASLPMNKDWMCCKSQWNALVKKYKSFFRYKTGEGTGEEAVAEEAKDWQYFDAMHEYASQKDNYHPPYFSSSAAPSTSRSSTSRSRSGTPQLRNRDERFQRLEQHIIRRDHKFERRVGSLLAVFGKMVQTDYPHINVDSLLVSSESDAD
ncbi:uncharacterized protein LOC118749192 isoform X2 [Rhagoletis pomonella]|uniref:uncharacterized protein LOC118749192 isoform X2 n=1 Tax=Rhagoletis pomonella TaxID=28610 RepID=UPI0017841A23|nr:uncharacterized protein LOC118749192 isoform X2 [Rhagoletis pomonella]